MNDRSETHRGGIVRIQIQGDDLFFVVFDEGRSIKAGSIAPARKLLQHEPVKAAELEAVIAEIEELVMPAMRLLPAGASLEGASEELGEVAEALPDSGGNKTVAIDDVENLFNRLAAVASGSPVRSSGIHPGASFALGLVLLREIMHHGGFQQVSVLP